MDIHFIDIKTLQAEATISEDLRSILLRGRSAYYDEEVDAWFVKDKSFPHDKSYDQWCGKGNTEQIRQGVLRQLERITRLPKFVPDTQNNPEPTGTF